VEPSQHIARYSSMSLIAARMAVVRGLPLPEICDHWVPVWLPRHAGSLAFEWTESLLVPPLPAVSATQLRGQTCRRMLTSSIMPSAGSSAYTTFCCRCPPEFAVSDALW
jgi:hypothetical protein